MSTILDNKISYLNETKAEIKNALNTKFNSQIQDNDTFRSYVSKINNIYDNWPKVSETNQSYIKLDGTKKGKIEISLKGNLNQKSLPNNYTPVNYIQSNGSQYINTGVYPYKTKTEITFQLLDNYAEQSVNLMLAGLTSGVRYIVGYLYYGQNPQTIAPANTDNKVVAYIPMDNNIHTLIYNDENNNLICDNQILEQRYSLNDLSSMSGKTLSLFGRTNQSTVDLKSSFKLYRCKIVNKATNILVRDFIPCYRNSDNEIGLYDLVNDVFYENQGDGSFTYGSVINNQPIQTVTNNNHIDICEENLWGGFSYQRSASSIIWTQNTDGSIELDGTSSSSGTNASITIVSALLNGYYKVLLPGTYYITGGKTSQEKVEVYDSNSNKITTDTGSGATFTLETEKKIIVRAAITETGQYDNLKFNIMLTKDNPPSSYKSYISQKYIINLNDIELCKIGNYQDEIYKQNNKWYLKKYIGKSTFNSIAVLGVNGTSSSSTTASANGTYSILKNNISSYVSNDIMYFPITTYEYHSNVTDNASAQNNLNDNTMCMRQNTNDRIYFKNSAFTGKTGNEISSLITGMTFYFIRTSPTTTEITNPTLLIQLNNLEKAYSYNGQTNIVQTNQSAPFILNADALQKKS